MIAAIGAGVRFFQYRGKHQHRRHVFGECLALAAIARKAGAVFIVNDHADIAAAVGADGVHLGQDDLPIEDARKVSDKGLLIGISTHSREQALIAQRAGADYIGFGPIFQTATKDAGPKQGLAALAGIRQAVSIPVIAIGGITMQNVREVQGTGADGYAVISAILRAPDLRRAADEFLAIAQP